MSSQGVDLGFGGFEADHSRTQQTDVTVISGNSFLALPITHPLAAHDVIPLAMLSDETFGSMQPEHAFERQRQAVFASNGAEITIKLRSQTVLPLLRFVALDQCCALVDPLTVASAGLLGMIEDRIVFRPIATPSRYDYRCWSQTCARNPRCRGWSPRLGKIILWKRLMHQVRIRL
ncbi:hypothetical protein KMP13_12430 [Epibacterium ulvae]|nr:hypothetical protein [Epibacterium ulvae]